MKDQENQRAEKLRLITNRTKFLKKQLNTYNSNKDLKKKQIIAENPFVKTLVFNTTNYIVNDQIRENDLQVNILQRRFKSLITGKSTLFYSTLQCIRLNELLEQHPIIVWILNM